MLLQPGFTPSFYSGLTRNGQIRSKTKGCPQSGINQTEVYGLFYKEFVSLLQDGNFDSLARMVTNNVVVKSNDDMPVAEEWIDLVVGGAVKHTNVCSLCSRLDFFTECFTG